MNNINLLNLLRLKYFMIQHKIFKLLSCYKNAITIKFIELLRQFQEEVS